MVGEHPAYTSAMKLNGGAGELDPRLGRSLHAHVPRGGGDEDEKVRARTAIREAGPVTYTTLVEEAPPAGEA